MYITLSMSKGGIEIRLSVLAKDEAEAIAMAEKEADTMLVYGDELFHTFILAKDIKIHLVSRTEKVQRVAQ